jgi:CRISPR-associated protein Csd1
VYEANALVSFELQGDDGRLICQRPAVQAAIQALAAEQSPGEQALCLVDGTLRPVARLHGSIKGVWGAQSSGANIVSFNLDAFNSYGKAQGQNAPVGEAAMFAYTTALNALLDRDSRNRVQVGDASTVFWADAPHPFDGDFTLADLFGEADNPDKARDAVRALYAAVRSGTLPAEQADTRFFVLGLSPNAARISIRFWLPHLRFAELAPRLVQHFDDIRVARRFDSDPETPSLFRLLTSVALQGKADNIPPRLAGECMRAVLEGLPLPAGLLNAAVQRCKAEQDVSYLRACALKAWLNRRARATPSTSPTFKEALDMDNPAPAYRLGRLFATLERIQEQAQPGINATIRDRYYGAASTTPVAVFTTLLRLKNAHLKKLSDGFTTYFEKLIGEILAPLDPVNGFPRQLSLPEQGQFALGYYHQRQAFFTKKPDTDSSANQTQGD